MLVQRIQENNYNPNFQAVVRYKKHYLISENVRAIVDKADDLYESILCKKATINGVTVQANTIGSRIVSGITKDEPIKLSKIIDGKEAELTIRKPSFSTELYLKVTKPNGKVSDLYYYDSIGNNQGDFISSYKTDGKQKKNIYKTYKVKNAAFEKYAAELLEPAEEIKKIFIG